MPVIAGYTSNPLVTKKSLHGVNDLYAILCMCKGTAAQIILKETKMPLPNIRNNCALQCHAKAKHSGNQCLNLAAYGGRVCRFHGARKPKSILRGTQHPNYKHGRETTEAKAKRSAGLARLRKIEETLADGSFYKLTRSKGRKPNGY